MDVIDVDVDLEVESDEEEVDDELEDEGERCRFRLEVLFVELVDTVATFGGAAILR